MLICRLSVNLLCLLKIISSIAECSDEINFHRHIHLSTASPQPRSPQHSLEPSTTRHVLRLLRCGIVSSISMLMSGGIERQENGTYANATHTRKQNQELMSTCQHRTYPERREMMISPYIQSSFADTRSTIQSDYIQSRGPFQWSRDTSRSVVSSFAWLISDSRKMDANSRAGRSRRFSSNNATRTDPSVSAAMPAVSYAC